MSHPGACLKVMTEATADLYYIFLSRELFLSCSNNSVVFSKFDGKQTRILSELDNFFNFMKYFPDNVIYCEPEDLIFDRTIVSTSLIQTFDFVCDRLVCSLTLSVLRTQFTTPYFALLVHPGGPTTMPSTCWGCSSAPISSAGTRTTLADSTL